MTTSKQPKAAKKTNEPAPYFWFKGASVAELVRRLTAAGPDTARLEVHLDGETMTFVVKSGGDVQTADDPPPINDSHRCPPSCG